MNVIEFEINSLVVCKRSVTTLIYVCNYIATKDANRRVQNICSVVNINKTNSGYTRHSKGKYLSR